MRITKIESFEHDVIDRLLKENIMNDFLFENHYFKIHIEDIEPIDYLYRRMYEEMYLRRSKYYISNIPEDGKMIMILSVSEAINFVKAALPPVFKHREAEAYSSIEELSETLATFIATIDSQYDYTSLFRRYTGLNYFETKTNYDFNRNAMLRKFESTKPIVDILISTKSHDILYEGIEGDELEDYEGTLYREPTGVHIQFVYNCIKKSELEYVYKIIDETNYYWLNGNCQARILNIFHSEFNGYFVEIYLENFDSEVCKTLYDIYRISYKSIIGK